MSYFTNKGTGFVARRGLRDSSVGATSLDSGIHDGSYTYVVGDHSPRATTNADSTTGASASGAPTGATGDINRIHFLSQIGACPADCLIMGTQTILAPVRHATLGINISQDATNNDGVQYAFGGNIAYNRFAHVVGTTPESFIRATLYVEDADGTDGLYVGWMKQATFDATLTNYTDYALIGDVSAAAKTTTRIASGTASTSGSLGVIADASVITLEVRIRKNGRVTYLYNGAVVDPVPGTTYTFANALNLIPFLHFIQDTNVTEVYLQKLEIGRRFTVAPDNSDEDLTT